MKFFPSICVFLMAIAAATSASGQVQGYYRAPAVHGETLVFVSEGDLWKVSLNGGVASRLTTHPGVESHPAISPDGKTVGFVASYDGVPEIYTMPLAGGLPTRRSYGAGGGLGISGFASDGRLIYTSRRDSTLPAQQLYALDLASGQSERFPLYQAYQGALSQRGSLIFTRFRHNQHCKRYQGGTAEQLWRYDFGANQEAVELCTKHPGTSRSPMIAGDRIYFLADFDGTMNVWSMNFEGAERKQHSQHSGYDVLEASLQGETLVYRMGPDLFRMGLGANKSERIEIFLGSDFDQSRERWMENPVSRLEGAHINHDGSEVILTARGQVAVAKVDPKRPLVTPISRAPGTRHREAVPLGDGKTLAVMSDESGEVELWEIPSDGSSERKPLSQNAKVLRMDATPSPDGEFIAFRDKDFRLSILNRKTKTTQIVDTARVTFQAFSDLAWSPEQNWLAYARQAKTGLSVIRVCEACSGRCVDLSSDRFTSSSPTFSADGKWLFFLSDRNFQSRVNSPWGEHQPEPYFEKKSGIYAIALEEGALFPMSEFAKAPAKKKADEKSDSKTEEPKDAEAAATLAFPEKPHGLYRVPAPFGNYSSLAATEKTLFIAERRAGAKGHSTHLLSLAIEPMPEKPKSLVEGIRNFQLSGNRKKILIRKGSGLHVTAAAASIDKKKLDKGKLKLDAWKIKVSPREDWRQIFVDAWRLHRDYYYDPGMHGVDWPAMRTRYAGLIERVGDRAELNDVLGQLIGELSSLHSRAGGGDMRDGPEDIENASLGARIVADLGAWRIDRIYRGDPSRPDQRTPLARPDLRLDEGDLIFAVDSAPFEAGMPIGALLREKVGKRIRLKIKRRGDEKSEEVVVKAISLRAEAGLRYADWEWSRAEKARAESDGEIGYIHLRAMGSSDMGQWVREYSSQYRKKGLVIDVRHNRGGNIDTWILDRLSREAWFYWKGRGEGTEWNMLQAFRGHLVVLCDHDTASDGEAFTDGFQRLKLGKVIGTRTWGGEIWLSRGNTLVDRGVASAGEYGVYSAEGEWLIEGHGSVPDIQVDNLPNAMFRGEDQQLDAALAHLKTLIAKDPREVPPPPAYPDKSSPDNRGNISVNAAIRGEARSFDGTSIAYESRGAGDVALVFIHGFACDRQHWHAQAETFARDYRVVTLDLAGHGESKAKRDDWSMKTLSRDVIAVADALALQKVVLIGHSMGGPVALHAAARLGGRCLGVVGVESLHDAEMVFSSEMIDGMLSMYKQDYEGMMRRVVGGMISAEAPEAKELVLKVSLAADRDAMLSIVEKFRGFNLKTLLRRSRIPIRCINAEGQPPMIPPTKTSVNRQYADYDALIMEGSGHYPMLEKSQTFNAKLKGVLVQLLSRR